MGGFERWLRGNPWSESAAGRCGHVGAAGLALLAAGCLVLSGCRQVASQAPAHTERHSGQASYAEAINKVAPAVVSIYTFSAASDDQAKRGSITSRLPFEPMRVDSTDSELQGLGSGVVTTADGYILTTRHVVEHAEKITAVTADGSEYEANMVGVDPATDLAVIKVRGRNLPLAVFGDSSRLRVGDVVLAIGNSFGVGQTVTSGIVSATERSGFGVMDFESFIQTDASINPGNSGGALSDAQGRVIGINSAILTSGGGSEGIGFAIPINMAKGVMRQLIAHGKVPRGYLGVSVRPLTRELARAFNIPAGRGAFVVEVTPASPAARAGVQEGDIIIQINGKPVEGSRAFRMQIAESQPGAKLELKVVRVGRHEALTAKLEEPPPAARDVKAVGGAE